MNNEYKSLLVGQEEYIFLKDLRVHVYCIDPDADYFEEQDWVELIYVKAV